MILYYITDRAQFAGDESERQARLLHTIAAAAKAGVDFIQLREKDLHTRELERLAGEALREVRAASDHTKLLINSRTDVALAEGADGVHLTSNDLAASESRAIAASAWRASASRRQPFTVAASCHSIEGVRLAESHGADFVVLAPIFAKVDSPGVGVELLAKVGNAAPSDKRVEAGDRRQTMPVLALGGVTIANAVDCLRAGAAGVAGIRLFQEGNVAETVARLRRAGSTK